jgi:tetratricopeptide (TPR) repeat protein
MLESIPTSNRSLASPDAPLRRQRVTVQWLRCYLRKAEQRAVAALSEFRGTFTARAAAGVGVKGYSGSGARADSDGGQDAGELLAVLVSMSVLQRARGSGDGVNATEGFSMHPLIRELAHALRSQPLLRLIIALQLAATVCVCAGLFIVWDTACVCSGFHGEAFWLSGLDERIWTMLNVVLCAASPVVCYMANSLLRRYPSVSWQLLMVIPQETEEEVLMLGWMLLAPQGPGQQVARLASSAHAANRGIAQCRAIVRADEADFRKASQTVALAADKANNHVLQVIVAFRIPVAAATLQKYAESWTDVAASMARAGCARQAEELAVAVVQFSSKRLRLDAKHPTTLAALQCRSAAAHAVGDWARARGLQEEVLALRRTASGRTHPDTLAAVRTLAITLTSLGESAAARKLQEEALGVSREQLGARHADTLETMIHLADSMWLDGDQRGAIKLATEAMEMQEQELGRGARSTLACAATLAGFLRQEGDLDRAAEMQREVLQLRVQMLGGDHPDTLAAMVQLVITLGAQGQLPGARRLAEEALSLGREVQGTRHPDTLAAMACLASVLCAEGAWGRARQLQQEVVDASTTVLGPSHRSTLAAKASLAAMLGRQEVSAKKSD